MSQRFSRKPRVLSDAGIEALREFADEDTDLRGPYRDSRVFGLSIHIGARSTVWRFRAQGRSKGRRTSAFKTIGRWPDVSTEEARKLALVFSGTVAAGNAAPGRRAAVKFADAFARYLDHLEAQAKRRGKPARWSYNARKLYDKHIALEFAGWTLLEMSADPRTIAEWHAKLSRSIPTTADHCARLIRACYRNEMRLDRSLSPALPTSGIRFGVQKPSQRALDFKDFGKWRKAWEAIPNPVARGYHLAALLCGGRPGELARLKRSDIEGDYLVIRNAKAGADIRLPISREIRFALNMALNAPPIEIKQQGLRGMKRGAVRIVERKRDPELVFPRARRVVGELPIYGNALRHTFRSVGVSLGISEMLLHFLMGHSLEGVSAKYTNELMIANSDALREAQEQISREMFNLLGMKLDPARGRRSE